MDCPKPKLFCEIAWKNRHFRNGKIEIFLPGSTTPRFQPDWHRCMAYSTTATQTKHSFTSSFQSEWRSNDSSSTYPSLSFYWCTTLQCRRLLDYSRLPSAWWYWSQTSWHHRNLGVRFDSCITMTVHVSQLVRGCVCQLRQIKTTRKFFPTTATVILINSFIVFRVDYNSILACLQTCQLDRTPSDEYNRSTARQPTLVACSQRIAYTCKLFLITYTKH